MKNKSYAELLKRYDSDTIVDCLTPYITTKRKQRIDMVLDHRLHNIQLAIESPSDINNALAAVRTGEALGVDTIHLISPEGEAVAARTITQGACYWVDMVFHDSLPDFLTLMKQQNYFLAGAVITAPLSLSSVPIEKPLCIMIGNETRGLSADAQAACDMTYCIPMFGMSESLNLSVSAAISLYEMTSRKRLQLAHTTDLQPQQRRYYQAKYYLNSVESRLAEGVLCKKSSRA